MLIKISNLNGTMIGQNRWQVCPSVDTMYVSTVPPDTYFKKRLKINFLCKKIWGVWCPMHISGFMHQTHRKPTNRGNQCDNLNSNSRFSNSQILTFTCRRTRGPPKVVALHWVSPDNFKSLFAGEFQHVSNLIFVFLGLSNYIWFYIGNSAFFFYRKGQII